MRAFRQISNNRWLARLDNLPTPPIDHISRVAQEYGIPAADIQLIETSTDPRVNPIMPPLAAPNPEEVEISQLDVVIQKVLANTATATEQRELLGRIALRLRNKGVLR